MHDNLEVNFFLEKVSQRHNESKAFAVCKSMIYFMLMNVSRIGGLSRSLGGGDVENVVLLPVLLVCASYN